MGANAVNTMCESIGAEVGALAKGIVVLKIISNLAVHRLARVQAQFTPEEVSTKGDAAEGAQVIDGVLEAYHFALADPFRATTNNKVCPPASCSCSTTVLLLYYYCTTTLPLTHPPPISSQGIMNAISPVSVATGQDWRAIEAGAHSYASYKTGTYAPLVEWTKNAAGNLVGAIELPMPVGLVGGASRVHPVSSPPSPCAASLSSLSLPRCCTAFPKRTPALTCPPSPPRARVPTSRCSESKPPTTSARSSARPGSRRTSARCGRWRPSGSSRAT